MSVLVEECEQIKRTKRNVRSSRNDSWRICQKDKMQTHSRQREQQISNMQYKKQPRERENGEAGRKQPRISKELPAVIKEGNVS